MAISTVRKGRDEVRAGVSNGKVVRERRPGAGRKRLEVKNPDLVQALDALVEPATRGDPESPLRWTAKSTDTLANELTRLGHPIGGEKVRHLLRDAGYSLQATAKVKEGQSHPDRDAQFVRIKDRTQDCIARGVPVISVDSKKKEAVGEHANGGREWQPKGKPVEVLTYDFPDLSKPKAIPYGIYDVRENTGYVNVGTDHDTPVFAVHSIERWWCLMGSVRYPNARELFMTADAGGSNSRMSRVWKAQLQGLADRYGLIIHVSHFPPGTSKWNKIEHRLFSFISLNWRGRPLLSYETVVSLIAATTTDAGLSVSAELDNAKYPVGIRVTKEMMHSLNLNPHTFHGDWNYTIRPRTAAQLAAAEAAAAAPKRKRVSFDDRKAKWLKLIEEHQRSGLSLRAFCRLNGMKGHSAFSQARRRILHQIKRRSPPNK